jgi:arginine exporter protein ArgO
MFSDEVDGLFALGFAVVAAIGLTSIWSVNPGARRKDTTVAGCLTWALLIFLGICIIGAAAGVDSIPLGPVEVRPVPAQRHR